jgi:predicted RecB family nuclease
MRITNDILLSYLNCKYKGYLKSLAKTGSKGSFEIFKNEMYSEKKTEFCNIISRNQALKSIRHNTVVSKEDLKKGFDYVLDTIIQADEFFCHIDALQKISVKSSVGNFSYVPILISTDFRVSKLNKLFLAFIAYSIARLQKKYPPFGKLVFSEPSGTVRVQLNGLREEAANVLSQVRDILAGKKVPRFILNKHCQNCEFRRTCYEKAISEDHLSLLGGIKEKDVIEFNGRGIFSVNQLSYTFRPRRKRKKVRRTVTKHHHALKALAIRRNRIYVYKKPELEDKRVKIYLDAEGDIERGLYYLIGILIDEGKSVKQHSFWIDHASNTKYDFVSLLRTIGKYSSFTVFHYGKYELKFLNNLASFMDGQTKTIERLITNSVDIFSIINTSVYFPTYSNSLKDIATYLGFEWSEEEPSGLQTIIWRRSWERTKEAKLKSQLILYNMEDCFALRKLVEVIHEIANANEAKSNLLSSLMVTDDFRDQTLQRFGGYMFEKQDFALDDFEYINRCSYFDYQRNKILIKTDKELLRTRRLKERYKKIKNKPNQEINLCKSRKCPRCKSKRLKTVGGKKSRMVVDLKFFEGGIKKWITKYIASSQKCQECGRCFLPRRYKEIRNKYGHNLISWVIYQNIVNFISFQKIQKTMADSFKISIGSAGVDSTYRLKSLAAEYYRPSYNKLLAQIRNSDIVHADETKVRVQGESSFVWILTNMKEVAFIFTENRKTDFLADILKDFKGVLISDFYKGYDALKYKHQKCLIHLIRDINNLLFKYQLNEELKFIASNFSHLLKKIISTIDKYGLKARHLRKYNRDVERFYSIIRKGPYETDVALRLLKRFETYKESLFLFLNHDGVPWNNNSAEHALKHFARYRAMVNGIFTEAGINKYLILLSIYETCRYKEVDFFKFLVSMEKYVHEYCKKYSPRGKKRQQLNHRGSACLI